MEELRIRTTLQGVLGARIYESHVGYMKDNIRFIAGWKPTRKF